MVCWRKQQARKENVFGWLAGRRKRNQTVGNEKLQSNLPIRWAVSPRYGIVSGWLEIISPTQTAWLCCAVLIKTRGENRRDEDFARGGGPKSNYLRSGGPTPVNASTKEEVLQAAAQQHAEASCWFPWTPVQHNRRRYFRH